MAMNSLIKSIPEFIGSLLTVALLGSTIAFFAGEVRLAALEKASHGSTRLSDFTAKMTKTNVSRAWTTGRVVHKLDDLKKELFHSRTLY
jgi:hypothetical protein